MPIYVVLLPIGANCDYSMSHKSSICFSATNKITGKCPEMTNEPESRNSNTPLHIAALHNRTEIATILLIQVSILFKMESLKLTHFVEN